MPCCCFSSADRVHSNGDQRCLGNLGRAVADKAHPSNPIQFKAVGQVSRQGTGPQGISAFGMRDRYPDSGSSERGPGTLTA